MTNDDFKKLLEDSLKPVQKQIKQIESGQESLRQELGEVQQSLQQDICRVEKSLHEEIGELRKVREEQIIPALARILNMNREWINKIRNKNRIDKFKDNAVINPPPDLILAKVL